MSAEGIAAIIVAITGMLAAFYNLNQSKRVQQQNDLTELSKKMDELTEEVRSTERKLEAAMRYIHSVNMELSKNGITPPPLPDELK